MKNSLKYEQSLDWSVKIFELFFLMSFYFSALEIINLTWVIQVKSDEDYTL